MPTGPMIWFIEYRLGLSVASWEDPTTKRWCFLFWRKSCCDNENDIDDGYESYYEKGRLVVGALQGVPLKMSTMAMPCWLILWTITKANLSYVYGYRKRALASCMHTESIVNYATGLVCVCYLCISWLFRHEMDVSNVGVGRHTKP